MTANYNIEAINVVLLEILEEIVVSIMDGTIENESDDNLVRTVTPLQCAVNMVTTENGDSQSSEITETAHAIEDGCKNDKHHHVEEESKVLPSDNVPQKESDSKMAYVVEKGSVSIDVECSRVSSGGDALSSESGHVEPTPTPEEGPLGDAMMQHVAADVLAEKIEPAEERSVKERCDVLIGKEGPAAAAAAAPEKPDPPRKNRFSRGWKRMKRTFRALLCCCCRG